MAKSRRKIEYVPRYGVGRIVVTEFYLDDQLVGTHMQQSGQGNESCLWVRDKATLERARKLGLVGRDETIIGEDGLYPYHPDDFWELL